MPWVRPVAVYGGASMERQISALKRGANIVVGTPGRLIDHIERRTLKLDSLKTVILDEADEMLNMGFREDIEKILEQVPEERQTVLFSATMPPAIMAISKKYLSNPEHIKVESAQRTVEAIEQYFYEVPAGRKLDALVLLLSMYEPKLSMIFCNTKKMVDELTEALNAKGFKASGIHGDMKQQARTQVMERFKSGRTPILIATDVAARGIDVDDVDAVFNYDIPQDNEYYIHRIGRTGRAGKKGIAFTFTSGRKQYFEMKEIQKFTKAIISQKALPSVEDIKSKKLDKFTEKLNKVIDEEKHLDYIDMVNNLCNSDMTVETLAAALLSMQLNKEIKNIPVIDTGIKSKIEYEKHIKPSGNRCKLMISAGKQQRIAPNFVLGALVEVTGLSGKSFGKIDIFDKHTTVEIPESEKENILMAMNNSKINGVRVSAQLIEGSSSGRNDNRNSKKNYKHHTDKHSNHKSKKSYRGRK
jgi:ATP-dependent RNA helicase DeaD